MAKVWESNPQYRGKQIAKGVGVCVPSGVGGVECATDSSNHCCQIVFIHAVVALAIILSLCIAAPSCSVWFVCHFANKQGVGQVLEHRPSTVVIRAGDTQVIGAEGKWNGYSKAHIMKSNKDCDTYA